MFNRLVGELFVKGVASAVTGVSGFIPIGVFGEPAVSPVFCLSYRQELGIFGSIWIDFRIYNVMT